jgi:type IV pilus assembly protein PilO
MNLLEELRNLDPNDPGRWPLPFRVGAVGVFFVIATLVLSWVLVYKDKKPELERKQAEEQSLRACFREKHQKAINLAVYEQQLKDIERSFGALLRQLPGKTEVPSLLVDISQTGLAAGLEEKLFQPSPEEKKDFYAELPIRIRLSGSYHEFGEFVSGIAALPRIVTLHDIEIKPEQTQRQGAATSYDELTLDLTARTYRYLDEEEIAAAEAEKRKQNAPRSGG